MFGFDSITGGAGGLKGGSSESGLSNSINQRFGNISFGDNAKEKEQRFLLVGVVAVVLVVAVSIVALKR